MNAGKIDLHVRLYRMYGEGRSAGFEVSDPETDEILFSMDIDVNRPFSDSRIYEMEGIRFRGMTPSQMMADKISVISTDKVFRRIKDIVDLYYLSGVFEFNVSAVTAALRDSRRVLGNFEGFLRRPDDLRHSYDKFRFAGGVNKPLFEEVYNSVKEFIHELLPED